MQLPCKGKNIDLALLGDAIEAFFRLEDYQVARVDIQKGFEIRGRPVAHRDKGIAVSVKVLGTPNKFTVDFSPLRLKSISKPIQGSEEVTRLFIGGWRTRERFQRMDRIIDIEKKFWSQVLKSLSKLENSAKG